MMRSTVKLLLLDTNDCLLLIHAKDPRTDAKCWYPVGGGVESGESLQEAAVREAREETGLINLPHGHPVWRRDHTYEFDGRVVQVHEDWLFHRVSRFEPSPTQLTDHETRSIIGFRWWQLQDLVDSSDTIYPPRLAELVKDLLVAGPRPDVIDITE